MKIISKTIKLLSLFLVAAVIVSCSDDDDNNGPNPDPVLNIVQTAVANDDLSSLVAALGAADGDLVNVLSGSGPFTVLAPTNAAFASFLSENGFASLEDVPTDVLSQVLLNHVISEDLPASNIVNLGSGYYKTNALGAGGQTLSLFVNTSNGVVFNDGSTVQTPDVTASNGIIHIVDKVIALPSIVDHAENNPDLSELRSKLADEGLVDALNEAGPFTVLAPVNSAFEAFTNPDENLLSQVLLNHAVSGAITSKLLFESTETYTSTLATGPNDSQISIYANATNGVTFNGVSTVVVPDIVGTNGIVHAVDGVIDIPTVVTFAAANPNFTSLVAGLAEADRSDADPMLIPTLSGYDGTYTVFAPLNSAFETLLNTNAAWDVVEDIDDNILNSVLLHHVVSGNVRSGDLEVGANVAATLEGDEITITLPGTEPNIADVTDGAGNSDIGIVAVDIQAGNGVIHVLNKVMLPVID
jgi:uncharacterized surface protein with fasciclin (FAS1) repeats